MYAVAATTQTVSQPAATELHGGQNLEDALYGMTMARLHGDDAEQLIREIIAAPASPVLIEQSTPDESVPLK